MENPMSAQNAATLSFLILSAAASFFVLCSMAAGRRVLWGVLAGLLLLVLVMGEAYPVYAKVYAAWFLAFPWVVKLIERACYSRLSNQVKTPYESSEGTERPYPITSDEVGYGYWGRFLTRRVLVWLQIEAAQHLWSDVEIVAVTWVWTSRFASKGHVETVSPDPLSDISTLLRTYFDVVYSVGGVRRCVRIEEELDTIELILSHIASFETHIYTVHDGDESSFQWPVHVTEKTTPEHIEKSLRTRFPGMVYYHRGRHVAPNWVEV